MNRTTLLIDLLAWSAHATALLVARDTREAAADAAYRAAADAVD